MLTSTFTRWLLTIGAAAVVTVTAPRIAHASSFSISVFGGADYIAPDDSGKGDVTFRVFNPLGQGFAIQLTKISVSATCVKDCTDDKKGDYMTDPALDIGTTCGVGAFLQDPDLKGCKVQVGFSLRDDRIPDPDVDYGQWTITLTVEASKAGDATTLGSGTGASSVYGLDKGASLP